MTVLDSIASPIDINTDRLRLLPLKIDDARELFSLLQDPLLYEYIPRNPPGTLSELLESYSYRCVPVTRDRDEIWLNWLGRLKQNDSPVGLFEVTVYSNGSAYIAYSVLPEVWRQGYGREGMDAIIREVLRPAGISHLIAEIDTRNHASVALVEALGFTRVKTTYKADSFKGHSSDEFRYTLDL